MMMVEEEVRNLQQNAQLFAEAHSETPAVVQLLQHDPATAGIQ